jgi:hypothetical protein
LTILREGVLLIKQQEIVALSTTCATLPTELREVFSIFLLSIVSHFSIAQHCPTTKRSHLDLVRMNPKPNILKYL